MIEALKRLFITQLIEKMIIAEKHKQCLERRDQLCKELGITPEAEVKQETDIALLCGSNNVLVNKNEKPFKKLKSTVDQDFGVQSCTTVSEKVNESDCDLSEIYSLMESSGIIQQKDVTELKSEGHSTLVHLDNYNPTTGLELPQTETKQTRKTLGDGRNFLCGSKLKPGLVEDEASHNTEAAVRHVIDEIVDIVSTQFNSSLKPPAMVVDSVDHVLHSAASGVPQKCETIIQKQTSSTSTASATDQTVDLVGKKSIGSVEVLEGQQCTSSTFEELQDMSARKAKVSAAGLNQEVEQVVHEMVTIVSKGDLLYNQEGCDQMRPSSVEVDVMNVLSELVNKIVSPDMPVVNTSAVDFKNIEDSCFSTALTQKNSSILKSLVGRSVLRVPVPSDSKLLPPKVQSESSVCRQHAGFQHIESSLFKSPSSPKPDTEVSYNELDPLTLDACELQLDETLRTVRTCSPLPNSPNMDTLSQPVLPVHRDSGDSDDDHLVIDESEENEDVRAETHRSTKSSPILLSGINKDQQGSSCDRSTSEQCFPSLSIVSSSTVNAYKISEAKLNSFAETEILRLKTHMDGIPHTPHTNSKRSNILSDQLTNVCSSNYHFSACQNKIGELDKDSLCATSSGSTSISSSLKSFGFSKHEALQQDLQAVDSTCSTAIDNFTRSKNFKAQQRTLESDGDVFSGKLTEKEITAMECSNVSQDETGVAQIRSVFTNSSFSCTENNVMINLSAGSNNSGLSVRDLSETNGLQVDKIAYSNSTDECHSMKYIDGYCRNESSTKDGLVSVQKAVTTDEHILPPTAIVDNSGSQANIGLENENNFSQNEDEIFQNGSEKTEHLPLYTDGRMPLVDVKSKSYNHNRKDCLVQYPCLINADDESYCDTVGDKIDDSSIDITGSLDSGVNKSFTCKKELQEPGSVWICSVNQYSAPEELDKSNSFSSSVPASKDTVVEQNTTVNVTSNQATFENSFASQTGIDSAVEDVVRDLLNQICDPNNSGSHNAKYGKDNCCEISGNKVLESGNEGAGCHSENIEFEETGESDDFGLTIGEAYSLQTCEKCEPSELSDQHHIEDLEIESLTSKLEQDYSFEGNEENECGIICNAWGAGSFNDDDDGGSDDPRFEALLDKNEDDPMSYSKALQVDLNGQKNVTLHDLTSISIQNPVIDDVAYSKGLHRIKQSIDIPTALNSTTYVVSTDFTETLNLGISPDVLHVVNSLVGMVEEQLEPKTVVRSVLNHMLFAVELHSNLKDRSTVKVEDCYSNAYVGTAQNDLNFLPKLDHYKPQVTGSSYDSFVTREDSSIAKTMSLNSPVGFDDLLTVLQNVTRPQAGGSKLFHVKIHHIESLTKTLSLDQVGKLRALLESLVNCFSVFEHEASFRRYRINQGKVAGHVLHGKDKLERPLSSRYSLCDQSTEEDDAFLSQTDSKR